MNPKPATYCTHCGLMRMKSDRGPCPKCDGISFSEKRPPQGRIPAAVDMIDTKRTFGNYKYGRYEG